MLAEKAECAPVDGRDSQAASQPTVELLVTPERRGWDGGESGVAGGG